jgi:hypothetical protein
MGPVVLIDKSKSLTDKRFGNWSSLFENSTLGVAITNSAFRFSEGESRIFDDARVHKQRASTTIVPRYLR